MTLILACLVDSCPLGDAFVVAAPSDDGPFGQVQNAFDGFAVHVSPCSRRKRELVTHTVS